MDWKLGPPKGSERVCGPPSDKGLNLKTIILHGVKEDQNAWRGSDGKIK